MAGRNAILFPTFLSFQIFVYYNSQRIGQNRGLVRVLVYEAPLKQRMSKMEVPREKFYLFPHVLHIASKLGMFSLSALN